MQVGTRSALDCAVLCCAVLWAGLVLCCRCAVCLARYEGGLGLGHLGGRTSCCGFLAPRDLSWCACSCTRSCALAMEFPDVTSKYCTLHSSHLMSCPLPSATAGGQICRYSEDFNARCVVLLHHGRHSMMRELQYGGITQFMTKYCTRPLVVLDADASSSSSNGAAQA